MQVNKAIFSLPVLLLFLFCTEQYTALQCDITDYSIIQSNNISELSPIFEMSLRDILEVKYDLPNPRVTDYAFSPNGRLLALATPQELLIFDIENNFEITYTDIHDAVFVEFLNEAQIIFQSDELTGSIVVWNLVDFERNEFQIVNEDFVGPLALSRGSTELAVQTIGEILVIDIDDFQIVLEIPKSMENPQLTTFISFTSDDSYLFIDSPSHAIEVWDIVSGERVVRSEIIGRMVVSSFDSTIFIIRRSNNTLLRLDLKDAIDLNLSNMQLLLDSPVRDLAVNQVSGVISYSDFENIYVSDEFGDLTHDLKQYNNGTFVSGFNPIGDLLLIVNGFEDNLISLWGIQTCSD